MCRDCEYGDYKYMNNGVDPYEIIDESIDKSHRNDIKEDYRAMYYDWLHDTAEANFDTSEWGDAEWNAWEEYIGDIV